MPSWRRQKTASASAVSYTHLDVYKRQANQLSEQIATFLGAEAVITTSTAVSYTHLDVYKRQVMGVIVLLFQAILLAHGGITTLGANTFSMAIVGPVCALSLIHI